MPKMYKVTRKDQDRMYNMDTLELRNIAIEHPHKAWRQYALNRLLEKSESANYWRGYRDAENGVMNA